MKYNLLSRLQAGLCLLGGSTTYNPSPVGVFDFNTDMDLTGGELLWYARPQLFFNCPASSLGRQHKELALVFVSTFEPIIETLNAIICRATECPCSTILQAAPTSPPCIFAGLRMCWAGYHSCCASWVEPRLRPCPTALVAARGQWLTSAKRFYIT